MFDLPVWQVSTTVRSGAGQWFAEFVATFGLIATILGCLSWAKPSIPYAVGLYITAAYWFTASTSFANPAVTIARALSNTFAGIAPTGVPGFIAAQMIGARRCASPWQPGSFVLPRNSAEAHETTISASDSSLIRAFWNAVDRIRTATVI